MLPFAAHGMITDIKLLDAYHYGKWMTVVILISGFNGNLSWTSGLLIMELMKDVTCDPHIKKNWSWSLWIHETYSKWTSAHLAGMASSPLPQGQHAYIWTSQLQNIVQQYSYTCVCDEHQTAQVCFIICILNYLYKITLWFSGLWHVSM